MAEAPSGSQVEKKVEMEREIAKLKMKLASLSQKREIDSETE